MIKQAYVEGIAEGYARYMKQNPEVHQALYKQAMGSWQAAGLGLLGGAGLGAGAMHLINQYQAKKQQQAEEQALQQALMQQYAGASPYYYG